MKKILPFITAFLLCSVAVFAQNREVTGTVTDADSGSPLPGANITVKGTSIGTASDVDGKYKLSVPANASTLVVSSVGYTTQEITLGVSNVVDVKLAASANELEEVVISVGRALLQIEIYPLPQTSTQLLSMIELCTVMK